MQPVLVLYLNESSLSPRSIAVSPVWRHLTFFTWLHILFGGRSWQKADACVAIFLISLQFRFPSLLVVTSACPPSGNESVSVAVELLRLRSHWHCLNRKRRWVPRKWFLCSVNPRRCYAISPSLPRSWVPGQGKTFSFYCVLLSHRGLRITISLCIGIKAETMLTISGGWPIACRPAIRNLSSGELQCPSSCVIESETYSGHSE